MYYKKRSHCPNTYMSVFRGQKISIIFQEHLVKQNKKNPGSKQVHGEQKQRQINSRRQGYVKT
jgi:ABC-type microcin C transport system duplicated ATPase subunit YejF